MIDFSNTLRDVMNKKRNDLESGASHDTGWVKVQAFLCLYFLLSVLLLFAFVPFVFRFLLLLLLFLVIVCLLCFNGSFDE
jgi:hypothetical protein